MAYIGEKYGIEYQERFLVLLEKTGGNISKAATAAGITGGRAMITQMRKKSPWFDNCIREYFDKRLDEAEHLIFKKAKSTFQAAKFLVTHHPQGHERGWGKRLELSGPKGKPLSFARIVERASKDSEREDGENG